MQYTPQTFLPSILDVHRSRFVYFFFLLTLYLFVFFGLLLVPAKRCWNFKNHTTPLLPFFSKLWIPSRPPVPLKLLGKLSKEEEAVFVELCNAAKVYWRVTLGTQQGTLPLCAPQPHPTETETAAGPDGAGLSGTIPNKRGFS